MTFYDVVRLADLKAVLDKHQGTQSNGKAALSCLVIFAKWHDPAIQLLKVIEALAEDFPAVKFFKADAETAKEICRFCGDVSEVPAVFFFEADELVARLKEATPPLLFSIIKAWSGGTSLKDVGGVDVLGEERRRSLDSAFVAPARGSEAKSGNVKSTQDGEPSEEKLRTLVNSQPVILFMKGTKSNPFCKFSRAAIGILDSAGIEYGTFDILSDEGVRQGLKKFSDWPTFPQLYVKGDFIGGVDILKELQEQGSLESTFPTDCVAKSSEDALTRRLKKLIGKEKVMLFMKGKPDEPRCGFSRQIVELLRSANISFGHFDILEDEEVRQGLKKLSNWPTYPQLYSEGNLVGGIDVVKEIINVGGADALREEIEAAAKGA